MMMDDLPPSYEEANIASVSTSLEQIFSQPALVLTEIQAPSA